MKKFSSSLKRVLSLLLAIVMMIGFVPINVLAEGSEAGSTNQKTSSRSVDAEGKPPVEWDKTRGKDRDDGSAYWSLPAGVSIVNAHNGPDPLNTFGFTYLGRYLDDQGRIVLKFDIGHRPTANSSEIGRAHV